MKPFFSAQTKAFILYNIHSTAPRYQTMYTTDPYLFPELPESYIHPFTIVLFYTRIVIDDTKNHMESLSSGGGNSSDLPPADLLRTSCCFLIGMTFSVRLLLFVILDLFVHSLSVLSVTVMVVCIDCSHMRHISISSTPTIKSTSSFSMDRSNDGLFDSCCSAMTPSLLVLYKAFKCFTIEPV